jgi:hypothetical protein
MIDTRRHAHELIDRMPDARLPVLVGLLETMVSSDEDGNTLSDAERQAVAEADEWLKHNKAIPHEEVLAKFGLTTADLEKMGQEP